jgi:C-5 cytosine-specific DNA methylase
MRDGKPLAIDLYCGLGGWTEGLLSEGYRVIGYDIVAHQYGDHAYPAELILQDVLTLDGSQFADADLIVGSSPCQEFSYRAMPWKRAKALPPPELGMALFHAQFRIQREASQAAGRHIPMVVENVRGAQPWVGRARWHYGSYYLWGDVPALMPMVTKLATKVPGFRFDGSGRSFQTAAVAEGYKSSGMNWSDRTLRGQDFTRVAGRQLAGRDPMWQRGFTASPADHLKDMTSDPGRPFGENRVAAAHGSHSKKRKAASAMIAKIPFVLAQHIARTYKPQEAAA